MADVGELPLALQGKHRVFEAMLEHGLTAIVLDPRLPGVVVPRWLQKQDTLVLNYAWKFHLQDFRFDAEAVEASLSFRGTPTFCRVPWAAVVAIRSEVVRRSFTWTETIPPALQPAAAAEGPGPCALPGVVEVEGEEVRAHSAAGSVSVEIGRIRATSAPVEAALSEAIALELPGGGEASLAPRRTANRPNLRVIGRGGDEVQNSAEGSGERPAAAPLAMDAAATPAAAEGADRLPLADGSPPAEGPEPEAPPPRPRPALRLVR